MNVSKPQQCLRDSPFLGRAGLRIIHDENDALIDLELIALLRVPHKGNDLAFVLHGHQELLQAHGLLYTVHEFTGNLLKSQHSYLFLFATLLLLSNPYSLVPDGERLEFVRQLSVAFKDHDHSRQGSSQSVTVPTPFCIGQDVLGSRPVHKVARAEAKPLRLWRDAADSLRPHPQCVVIRVVVQGDVTTRGLDEPDVFNPKQLKLTE